MHSQVHLKNVRRIPDKIFQGEQITDFEIYNVDWEKVLTEHKERVEKETSERIRKLEKQEAKHKSWALYT